MFFSLYCLLNSFFVGAAGLVSVTVAGSDFAQIFHVYMTPSSYSQLMSTSSDFCFNFLLIL